MEISDIDNVDLARILEINTANVPAVGPVDLDQLRFLADESTIALKLSDGEEIAGFCLVLGFGSTYDSVNYRWFMEHHPDSFYLDRVAFDQRHQGRGFGSALYEQVDRTIRNQHAEVTSLTLEVNADPPNEQSLAFHARLGFVEVGRQMSKGIEVSLLRRTID